MEDPVTTIYGHIYEKEALLKWIDKYHTDPITRKKLTRNDVFPALPFRNAIQEFKIKQKFYQ